jgi:hypothetical protein
MKSNMFLFPLLGAAAMLAGGLLADNAAQAADGKPHHLTIAIASLEKAAEGCKVNLSATNDIGQPVNLLFLKTRVIDETGKMLNEQQLGIHSAPALGRHVDPQTLAGLPCERIGKIEYTGVKFCSIGGKNLSEAECGALLRIEEGAILKSAAR